MQPELHTWTLNRCVAIIRIGLCRQRAKQKKQQKKYDTDAFYAPLIIISFFFVGLSGGFVLIHFRAIVIHCCRIFYIFCSTHPDWNIPANDAHKKKQILTGAFMAKGTSCTYTYIRGTHFAETLFYLSLTKYEICAERLWWVSDLFDMTCWRSTGQNLVKYCFVNKRELIHINRIFDEVLSE